MLVLSRKKDEKVMIGDGIEVTVVEVKGDTVKLGISAPKDVKIYRGELLEAIRQANIEAANIPATDLGELEKKLRKKE
jgi:carbon storage regulator